MCRQIRKACVTSRAPDTEAYSLYTLSEWSQQCAQKADVGGHSSQTKGWHFAAAKRAFNDVTELSEK